MCRLNVGGGTIGVKEDKSRSQRDTKKEVREDRSHSFKERYELLLLGADKGPSEKHRNTENVPQSLSGSALPPPPPSPLRLWKEVAAYGSRVSHYLVFASLARRSVDCCADVAPLSCLPDCRLRPLTPPTPEKEHGICCCVTTRTVFNNGGQDFVKK